MLAKLTVDELWEGDEDLVIGFVMMCAAEGR